MNMHPIQKIRTAFRLFLKIDKICSYTRDLYAAQVFHDRILDSPWFTRQCLSPGQYAVDYGFLKTLYNVLTAMRPHNILEFGLGQSSKLVHQYAAHFGVKALTCEHNDDWISFFFRSEAADATSISSPATADSPLVVNSSLGYPIKIRRLPLETIKVRNVFTTSYRDVEAVFSGEKFDFILVDGPCGTDRFSRPQIIAMAEHNLAERFCIMVDDSHRPGEQETIFEVQASLRIRNIPFVTANRTYCKTHSLILSPSLAFLGTT